MRIPFSRFLVCSLLLFSLTISCKKSQSHGAEDPIVTDPDVEQSLGGSYTIVSAHIGQINIIGPETVTPLKALAKSKSSFKLADVQTDAWDNAIWSSTEVFNCFGPCDGEGHSNTPSQFVAQAINPDRQASPMASVQESVALLCLLSQIFDNTALPAAGSKKVSFDSELRDDLASACPYMDVGETDFDATITVTDLTGTMFDKKIEFTPTGQTASTVYLRNNGKFVNIGRFEGSADSVRRTILSFNQESGIFRFELIGLDNPGDINKSLNFYRGFIDENSSEMRFTAVMGSNFKTADRWQNLSFLTVNGQFGQNEIGATISRQDAQSSFQNKFVCFKGQNTTFVNNTACTEDPMNDRKSSWSYTSQLFIDLAAKTPADWKLTENTVLAEFDATTIFTLPPIYQ